MKNSTATSFTIASDIVVNIVLRIIFAAQLKR